MADLFLPLSPADRLELERAVRDRWSDVARKHGTDARLVYLRKDGTLVAGGSHEYDPETTARALSSLAAALSARPWCFSVEGTRVVGHAAARRVDGFQWRDGADVSGYRGRPLRTWELRTGEGKIVAEVWHPRHPDPDDDFTWHTWDVNGTGGENASDRTLDLALREVKAALVRQAASSPRQWHDAAALVRIRDLPPDDPRRKARREAGGRP